VFKSAYGWCLEVVTGCWRWLQGVRGGYRVFRCGQMLHNINIGLEVVRCCYRGVRGG